MPLSGCVKTPLGIVAEWFASELQGVEFANLIVRQNAISIEVVVFPTPDRYVIGMILMRDVIAGAEDPQTLRVLTKALIELKEQL